MPLYNSDPTPYAVGNDETQVLVNNETLGAGNKSRQVTFARMPGKSENVSIEFSFPANPTVGQYEIQIANQDVDALYSTIQNGTIAVAGSTYQRYDISLQELGYRFKFLRVKEDTSPDQPATITVLG